MEGLRARSCEQGAWSDALLNMEKRFLRDRRYPIAAKPDCCPPRFIRFTDTRAV